MKALLSSRHAQRVLVRTLLQKLVVRMVRPNAYKGSRPYSSFKCRPRDDDFPKKRTLNTREKKRKTMQQIARLVCLRFSR
jgi:hypothetical protein